MGANTVPHEIVLKATNEDLVPLGEFTARGDGKGYALTYPKIAENHNGVDDDTEFKVWLDRETGAVVYLPD